MKRSLSPLKKPGKSEKFAVADIEARSWIKFLVVGYYDGTDFRHFTRLDNFFDHAFASDSVHIFCHFGGIYDFLFFLSHLLRFSRYQITSLIPRGSGILCFDVRDNALERTLHFHDSSALFPMSLDRITKAFGVTHNKLSIDYDRIKRVTKKLITYLEHDCKGLYESLEIFFSDPHVAKAGPRYTIAGQAVAVLRTFISSDIPACPLHIDSFVRAAYAGGRTEIFRPLFKGKNADLHCYDFNSLYPAVMADAEEMPSDFISKKFELDQTGFLECTVEVPRETYIPVLWTKELNGNQKFCFPTGKVSGCYPTCEIREALKQGARILSTGRFYRFRNGGPFLRNFARSLYEVRQRSTNPVSNTVAKLLLNSAYGRMGIGLEKESIDFDHGQPGVTPFREIRVGSRTVRLVREMRPYHAFSNVAIAAWITALARLRLYRELSPVRDSRLADATRAREVFYCDTDSIYTTTDLPTGDGLGALKLESSSRSACFLLPKTYWTDREVKMKGFDKKKIQHFQFEDFHAALEGDFKALKIEEGGKMLRFKSALAGGKLLSMGKPRSKQIRSLYDKRELIKTADGWDSRPWHID